MIGVGRLLKPVWTTPVARSLAAGARVLVLVLVATTCQVDELITPGVGNARVLPGQVTDSASVGSIRSITFSVSITNSGVGSLTWTATIVGGAGWLSLSTTSGAVPSTVDLTLDPTGLFAGTYRDTIRIAPDGGADTTRLPVEFIIHPCLVWPVTTDEASSDSLTTADCGAPGRSGSFAKVFQFDGSEGDSVTVSMTSSDFDSYLIVDAVPRSNGRPLGVSDDCRGSGPDACVVYVLLPSDGTYVIEATSSVANDTGSFDIEITPPRLPMVPSAITQLRSDTLTILPVGGSVTDSVAVVQARVADPDTVDVLRLEVEVQPVGTPFTGVPTDSSETGYGGDLLTIRVDGLPDNMDYHWQLRTADHTGRPSAWTSFGANAEGDGDFRVGVPEAPNDPTDLGQFKSDGSTPIAVADSTDERTVVLAGTVEDIDPIDQLRLEVEVREIGTPFTGTPTGSSVQVASGGVAEVTITGLADDAPSHWRARTIDQTGRTSSWISFGGNQNPTATRQRRRWSPGDQ